MMISAAHPPPLDLTEDNVREVLADARIHVIKFINSLNTPFILARNNQIITVQVAALLLLILHKS